MKYSISVLLAAASIMLFNPVCADDFPEAPPKLNEMKTKGYPQLSAQELQAFFPGKVIARNVKGRKVTFIFETGGALVREAFKDKPGTWRIDESNNAYCKSFQRKQGPAEHCFTVFRDPDGVHFHDYDLIDGFLTWTWRRIK